MQIIKELFDFNKLNYLILEKGRVLISDPFLNDNYFSKSVVLLCELNKEGGFGLVLNNFIQESLSDLLTVFSNINCSEFKISAGGPMDVDSIFYIHTRPDLIPNSIQIHGGLFLGDGQEFNSIAKLIQSKQINSNEIRFFLGYSGWTPGQLQEELNRNSWFVGNLSVSTTMHYQETDIWKKTLEQMSDKHRVISNFPVNPKNN